MNNSASLIRQTNYHTKYFAHDLTRQGGEGIERFTRSLFDACVDLNPHQIEASIFALRSPLSKGVLLADEVGLGKTIEAGLVLCQYWAEGKRRLLVICPASLRKQWAIELEEKFNLPTYRIALSKFLLKDSGIFYIRCDYNGNYIVRHLLDSVFGSNGFQYELLVQRIRKNVTGQGKISLPLANDSLFLAYNSVKSELANPYLKLDETRKAYWRRIDDSAGFRNPPERIIFGHTFFPYKRDAHFKYSQESIDRMSEEGRIKLSCKNRSCDFEMFSGRWTLCPQCGSSEATPKYLVEATDQKVLDTNWMDLAGYSSTTGFSTENAESLLRRVIDVATHESDTVADYFAGSGTTLAVALKMSRRWIGVEMGEQFGSHILPRLKKTCTSESISACFKYIRLESYEDTLNNLILFRSAEQDDMLSQAGAEQFREDYMLGYMLDLESQDSLLNVKAFEDPFNYELQIATGTAGETKATKVDMVETFNYLIGLTVKHMDHIQGFRIVEGTNPKGDKVLVIWRNTREKSNADLDAFFKKQRYNTRDQEYDLIYVNGDNNLENLCREDQTWKVRLIEEDFHRLMFDVQDV